jgi:hypothetical protein
MIQEIFIIEDIEDLINHIKPKFRGKKDFLLRRIPSRTFK